MANFSTAYVGLGSNLDNPIHQIKQALLALDTLTATHLKVHSALYRSKPLGPPNQPDYINAVAMLATQLRPPALLQQLQAIENQQGRVRGSQRWGPRTLDLDILLYDNQQSQDYRLTLPHPGLYDRAFVLYPLGEISPDLVLPDGQRVYDLMQHCETLGLEKLENEPKIPNEKSL
jgi:2-amino-4-hydroxy-6-hydroxymethyldihydropteridine diphosphokinase